MFDKIFRNKVPIFEKGFAYHDLKDYFDVSFNFIDKDSKIPPHTHEQNVFNYVFEGEFLVSIDANVKTYSFGQWVYIPENTTHSVEALTPVILLELWEK